MQIINSVVKSSTVKHPAKGQYSNCHLKNELINNFLFSSDIKFAILDIAVSFCPACVQSLET